MFLEERGRYIAGVGRFFNEESKKDLLSNSVKGKK